MSLSETTNINGIENWNCVHIIIEMSFTTQEGCCGSINKLGYSICGRSRNERSTKALWVSYGTNGKEERDHEMAAGHNDTEIFRETYFY